MHLFPHIEGQDYVIQQDFQMKKLKVLLNYLQQNSPYYQKKFKEYAIEIQSIKTLNDLHLLPTTCKEDLQQHQQEFLCIPVEQVREYTSTSGSLGKPVIIAMSKNDLDRLAYNEMLSFQLMGLTEKDVVQLMLTLDRQFMAGMAYYKGLEKIGAAIIRNGPGLVQLQWETIAQLKPSVLISVPSFLLKMLAEKPVQFNLQECSVQKILLIGESIRTEELKKNPLLNSIFSKWPVKLFGTYASTEMQTAFTECEEGHGGHHHPELILVEILDEEGIAVAPGEAGEVVITTLGVEAMPLLRYRTGDICKAYYDPCKCGRKTMRLGPVLGRKKQMIKYKGTSIYPSSILEILTQIEEIEEYVFKIQKDVLGQDQLTVYISTPCRESDLVEKLRPLFQQKIRVIPEIRFLKKEELTEMQFKSGNRKPVRIQDLR